MALQASRSVIFAVALLASPLLHAQQDISGNVIDAVTNQGVPRALVRLGSRATLAGSDGHFSFASAGTSNLSITAVKPGYSFTQFPNDPSELALRADQLAAPVTLRLYPDGLLKGTISSPAGEPLPGVDITIQRADIESYGERWVYAAHTRSDIHGQFRAPVPAGDYRIQSNFSMASGQAVLPTVLPQPSASVAGEAIHLHSDEQLSFDLHPTLSPLVEATIRSADPARINLLKVIPSDGPAFNIPPISSSSRASASEGETHVRLPLGSYTIQARRFGSDEFEQADFSLTGTPAKPPLIQLHVVPSSVIPIEVIADTSSPTGTPASNQSNPVAPPNPRALGLLLEPTLATADIDSAPIRPTQQRGQGDAPSFMSFNPSPGTYRLRSQSTFFWYIRSATYGGTDLLNQDLLAAPGTSSTPITLVVSNALASLTGNVTLNGQPATCNIYLFATFPTTTPMLTLRSRDDGSFALNTVPPGTYRAIAFQSRQPINPSDSHALDPYTTHIGSVTLQAAQQATLTLDAVPDTEIHP